MRQEEQEAWKKRNEKFLKDQEQSKNAADRLTPVEDPDDYGNFLNWVCNGKKDDFGVSKKLFHFD